MKITALIVSLFVFHVSAYGEGVFVPGEAVVALDNAALLMCPENILSEKINEKDIWERESSAGLIDYFLSQVKCEPVVGINDFSEKAVGISV
jgi:hypothetical protein